MNRSGGALLERGFTDACLSPYLVVKTDAHSDERPEVFPLSENWRRMTLRPNFAPGKH